MEMTARAKSVKASEPMEDFMTSVFPCRYGGDWSWYKLGMVIEGGDDETKNRKRSVRELAV